MQIHAIALTIAAAILGGCSTQATLTLRSQPDGAYFVEKNTGKQHGIAPVTVYYDASTLANHKGTDGCFLVNGFEARWVSGTTAGLELVRLCASSSGNYEITFARDLKAPEFERDLQFALQLQTTRAQQQQAKAAQDAAAAALYRSLAPPPRRALNCTSTQVGNTVQTTCY